MKRCLSLTEVAQRLGVTKGVIARYKLPEPDVYIGSIRGWNEPTIECSRACGDGPNYAWLYTFQQSGFLPGIG